MLLTNTNARYGVVSKCLHWIIALLVIFEVSIIYWVKYGLPPKSPSASFYISGLHKPIGMLVLILAILAVIWRMVNGHPSFPFNMPGWEKLSARVAHILLYLGILIMPISGTIMSTAAGYPPNFFGLYQVPAFIEKNPALSKLCFEIHETTATILIGVIIIHTLAALKHHFVNRDKILKRMLPWG